MQKIIFPPTSDRLPPAADDERAKLGFEAFNERIGRLDDESLAAFLTDAQEEPAVRRLLEATFGGSPFLGNCIAAQCQVFAKILQCGPESVVSDITDRLKADTAGAEDEAAAMRILRQARSSVAMAVGLADIADVWSLEDVVGALSAFADAAIGAALSFLLKRAAERGELELADTEAPEKDCGLTILGMGKLGAKELNYSSDVDLIVIYDPDKAKYLHDRGPQEGYSRMTRALIRLLEERTRDGYVFRMDLRLRPDPSAMPLAISFRAAETYYESLGQNWERAAMIKARPVAGDVALGREFLDVLRPFVWRKHLDFWAIQDVHSIKRQIYAHKGGADIDVEGHNIKLGRGGIREIEFFVQTQQLIWGGRDASLRTPRTIEALEALAASGHIEKETADDLSKCYRFLRRLEHRLQMVADKQTQNIPENGEELAELAAFLGHADSEAFREALLEALRTVEDHYADLFEEETSLSGPGNLVFTGGEPDPDTLETLRSMGFSNPEKVFNLVRVWHHGRYRATRSRRSREILTELMPTLLQELAGTADPDMALAKFDEFLERLPAGVQLFSMLYSNPMLLDLLAEMMGDAPRLAEHLSRNAGLLEAVLEPGFFDEIPDLEALREDLDETLRMARDFQDVLDISRRWVNDRKFQAGVHLLRHPEDVDQVGRGLADIAEASLRALWQPVTEELARRHGHLPPPGMAVLGLGKLGGREMTVSSDLDLIFVYEVPEGVEESDGEKPLAVSQYYGRLAQRYITALTSLTGEGQLYEVDMRLRPSGNAGPLAVSLERFRSYQASEAWTWEHMALTRARVILGDDDLAGRIDDAVSESLTAERDPEKLLASVADMRRRIEDQHKAKSIWKVKYLRGGLVDLEFLSQYWQLRHAHEHPQVLARNTQDAFHRLAEAGVIERDTAELLIDATRLMRRIQGLLRLTVGSDFDEDSASDGIKQTLARAGKPQKPEDEDVDFDT
ncbi:MAG: bifunctional [glutamine synthetase] adenylyltransferase/[glutamine synthetase]-adenylyl-L-tyrosine phosphorylase, partial [Rhodovibrionaceae bacterium]|nr:bifunctional [glutamine synthetase] adenylyltransferase/[glutamine synthetase]-adenylyl-L-tyrosine phosphorylase [Rhodovibrionaceae bacterium]